MTGHTETPRERGLRLLEEHERTERLLEDSDAAIARTEEIIGCPIGEFVLVREEPDRREIDRRNKARENSDRRQR